MPDGSKVGFVLGLLDNEGFCEGNRDGFVVI